MENEDKLWNVYFRINMFLVNIQNYMAAYEALETLDSCKEATDFLENKYILISKQAIERQFIMETTQIFDKAHFQNNDNCSFKLLKELCLDEGQMKRFPSGVNDEIIIAIEKCCNLYEKTFPNEIRNKMMAHHDLEAILSPHTCYIPFNEIRKLIDDSIKIIEEVGCRLSESNQLTLKFESFDSLVADYQNSIKSFFK